MQHGEVTIQAIGRRSQLTHYPPTSAHGSRRGASRRARRPAAATGGAPEGRSHVELKRLYLQHANIIKYCKSPFANARDMDRTMMTAWKSVVGPDDTVLNGGDVALAGNLGEIRPGPDPRDTGAQSASWLVGNHDFHKKTGLLDAAARAGRRCRSGK